MGVVLTVSLTALESKERIVLGRRGNIMDVIYHPSDDPLYGIKLRLNPRCQLPSQRLDLGIPYLDKGGRFQKLTYLGRD